MSVSGCVLVLITEATRLDLEPRELSVYLEDSGIGNKVVKCCFKRVRPRQFLAQTSREQLVEAYSRCRPELLEVFNEESSANFLSDLPSVTGVRCKIVFEVRIIRKLYKSSHCQKEGKARNTYITQHDFRAHH